MCKFFKVYGVRFNEAQALHQQQLTAELQPRNLVRRSGLQRITKHFSTMRGLACTSFSGAWGTIPTKAMVNLVNFFLSYLRVTIDGQGKGMQICRGLGSGMGFGQEYSFIVRVEKGNEFHSAVGDQFYARFWRRILILTLCPHIDGEGDPGAAHPPPGAGEGQ